jgi:PKD repeat protein
MKHGAIVGLALGAMVMLGVLGSVSGPAPGVQAGLGGEEAKQASLLQTGEFPAPAGAEAALAAVEDAGGAPVLEHRVQVASAGSPAALLEVVKSVGAGQIVPVFAACDEVTEPAFVADPTAGPAALATTFRLSARHTNGSPLNITVANWYFSAPNAVPNASGDYAWANQLLVQVNPLLPLESQLVAIGGEGREFFPDPGLYSVGVRLRIENPANPDDFIICPAPGTKPFIRADYITVFEEVEIDPANFEVVDLITQNTGMGLVPLNDWVPLFWFDMTYAQDQFAPRTLTQLRYSLGGSIRQKDIIEFGLFADTADNGEPDQLFDLSYDGYWQYVPGSINSFRVNPGNPILTWFSNGFPYEMPNGKGEFNYGDMTYDLNFTFDPNAEDFNSAEPFALSNPTFPFVRTERNTTDPTDPVIQPFAPIQNWVLSGREPHRAYIVAVRLSSLWASGSTVSVVVDRARMQQWSGPSMIEVVTEDPFPHSRFVVGFFPVNNDGSPKDSYSPNFYEGDFLSEGATYTSQFDVYDLTGDTIWGYRPGTEHNLWNWPLKLYTPVAEHTRPRWDISDTFVDAMTGEWLDLRHVFPVDSWVPVLGINMHGQCNHQIEEVNLILTDIGADPFGPPGNGGFNPNYALESFTTQMSGAVNFAVQTDYSFNGAWVYYDTGTTDPCTCPPPPEFNYGDDGIFTPPSPADASGASFGITFSDFPMYPEQAPQGGYVNRGVMQWQYVPFPPGGGDPWWKIALRFAGGRRRTSTDPHTGYFEICPDYFPPGVPGTAFEKPDYFVVLHTDSGFKDLSGKMDGNGMIFGADFRAFIEPRRWNPQDGGHWDGGLLTTNMNVDRRLPYWQDSEWLDWDTHQPPTMASADFPSLSPQPWWHERMHDRDNVKPQRSGFEIHDLVMTYSTNNDFARESYIMHTQIPPIRRPATDGITDGLDMDVNNAIWENLFFNTGMRTYLSLWADPSIVYVLGFPWGLGIMNSRFDGLFSPGTQLDLSEGVYFGGATYPNADELTSIQYAFETVPFEPVPGDPLMTRLAQPRTHMYPQPFAQPTLPDYGTWPLNQYVGFGFQSRVWADAASLANNIDYYGQNTDPNAEIIETWDGREASYRDDIYFFEVLDGTANFSGEDLSGAWLVDSNGGRFLIHSNSGNVLRLVDGHAAYISKRYEFPAPPGDPDANLVDIPHYPYGVQGGVEFAVPRGAWVVARESLPRNRYPQLADWPVGLGKNTAEAGPNGEARAARILRQHVEYHSQPTAMLGINLVGADDPVVNRHSPTKLNNITVAFWGPEFDPNVDLAKLDSDTGYLFSSGVLLYEDRTADGVFTGPILLDISATPLFSDTIVPVEPSRLRWATAPEAVDLDGDNVPDDMSGDGIITNGLVDLAAPGRPALTAEQLARWDGLSDLAWVLMLRPQQPWLLPQSDIRSGGPQPPAKSGAFAAESVFPGAVAQPDTRVWPSFWTKTPTLLDLMLPEDWMQADGPVLASKALAAGGHLGDDLYVVVRTSETISAFEQFRCVVPSRLPDRTPLLSTFAGLEFSNGLTSRGACFKTNPEEEAVQDFYGHDMLEVSVPARVVDLSESLKPTTDTPQGPVTLPGSVPVIIPGGPPTAVLGIDVSANRLSNRIAYGAGEQAQATTDTFTPRTSDIQEPKPQYYAGQGWTADTVGLWLIGFSQTDKEQDKRVEAYQIIGVQNDTLRLRAGAPRNGSPWVVVKDPTFLEQVIVEFHDASDHTLARDFNPRNDFIPLDFEDPANDHISGVSLYRDNDWHPLNRNGVFDPPVLNDKGEIEYIDLPVRLDDVPAWIGLSGEDRLNQVWFTFSSPGTDNSVGRDATTGGTSYESQARLRQWIPQCFGTCPSDGSYGPDFFVVVRTSRQMSVGDTFRAAIVSWGPDTPSEPDPDNFSNIYPAAGDLQEDMADLFSEFPWGSRGLGFITFFKQTDNPLKPPMYGPVYRYWAIDDTQRKPVARTELDFSQDAPDRLGLHWIRSNPAVNGRTQPITSLPVPKVDFIADRHRQVVGGPVKFTLQATGSIVEVLWDFGDGESSADRNPAHSYARTGLFTVSVTVTDRFGISVTESKRDFIEILAAPFVDFIAVPTDGTITPDFITGRPPGLDVKFTDLSVGTDKIRPQSWFWTFGDNRPAVEATQQNPTHRYLKEGFYTVTLEVTFVDTTTGAVVKPCYQILNYITVRPCIGCPGTGGEGEGEGTGEGEATETPAADFKVVTAIRDKEGLVPLIDWVPLFNFTMGFAPDNPADRILRSLTYRLRPDQRDPDDLNYMNQSGPEVTDLLEFGLFREFPAGDEKYDRKLDEFFDFLLFKWDNTGFPVGRLLQDNPYTGLVYQLDFIGNGTADNPEFPVPNGPTLDDGMEGISYIVAVRTSPTWRSQLTMGCDVLGAEMILPTTGVFPVNNEGAPVDSYDPNFFEDNGTLEPEEAYSSSFTTWDITGTPEGRKEPTFFDSWNYPTILYTPLAEHTRPRWSKFNQVMDIMPGELLALRRLISLDTWVDMIGINVHSTKAVHDDSSDPLVTGPRFNSSKDAVQLREVNLVLTDIGADPFGPPGNGGFNPVTGLKPVTTSVGVTSLDSETAIHKDITFNGAWVWHDTNNNGLFDPPTPNELGGVTFNGDYPLFPDSLIGFDPTTATAFPTGQTLTWEYIPLPPGGGDPWWKLHMRFWGGRRRLLTTDAEDDVEGFVEKVPDNVVMPTHAGSEYTSDYFVVIRTDSGYKDVSLAVPDGTGIAMGADFRAFIEPRRVNAAGFQDGGIYIDSMIPAQGSQDGLLGFPWQTDSRWGIVEPWWPQRTVNQDSTKPVRVGLDVHDLVLTYQSDSHFASATDLFFGSGSFWDAGCMGFSAGFFGAPTDFGQWMDPFGLIRSQFLNGHSVGVTRWHLFGTFSFTLGTDQVITLAYDYSDSVGHFAYETAPFENQVIDGLDGRSSVYPNPMDQPVLPDYATWPATLAPGEYPRASQWAEEDARARLLTQKTDISSDHTGMLGINAVGSNDPVVVAGQEKPSIAQITVAFWGPDFHPDILLSLDPQGRKYDSGVLLWEDTDKNGVFLETQPFIPYSDLPLVTAGFDQVVPVRDLRWGTAAEPLDLDGDGVPDDMNGDRVVDQRDYGWVLTLTPEVQWELPQDDFLDRPFGFRNIACMTRNFGLKSGPRDRTIEVFAKDPAEKQAEEDDGVNPGDDLFISVRTSDKARRFQAFRAVIPATLPGRAESMRKAGIQFFPQVNTSASAFLKVSPEEDPVQDFYGHDMLEFNIPVKILDMTNQQQSITIGGAALPVMGLDLSTNRTDGTLLAGATGLGSEKAFTVPAAAWTPNGFAGDWLVDSGYETYEIVTNTANQLTLFSGRPRDGSWRIVRDPSFLEQVIIEIYNEGQDADFNPVFDLLPLDLDQELSGVALYRDNDQHPDNRNGLFDPGIDIPLPLDAPPRFVGQTGESTQVKFVFSSPGTDDIPLPRAQQARNRQWVPDTFGDRSSSPFYGADFFLVMRASENMQVRDNFRVGLVSWGPNTPTEPDPDTWASLPGEDRNEFSKFVEFPWGARGLGFITFFKTPQVHYFMDGYRAGQKADNSGVNWLRSQTAKKRRSGVVTAQTRPISPTSVIIESASVTKLPSQTLPGQSVSVVIYGKNFGTSPAVLLTGYDVQVTQATNTAISISLSTAAGAVPQEPLVLIVRNPATNEEASRSNLFYLIPGNTNAQPVISGVSPARGAQKDFPVRVLGANFAGRENVEVLFGRTLMPVIDVPADGKSIQIGFPMGGLPVAGALDVTVRNKDKAAESVLVNGFEYVNDAQRPRKDGFFGCGPGSGEKSSGGTGDALAMALMSLALAWPLARRGFRKAAGG